MSTALIGPVAPPGLHVMTFNIRRRLTPALRRVDRWSYRRGAVAALLETERPHILGVQEALPDQARDVHTALGARYVALGHGRRRDGGGEACLLFFDADRLELEDWRQIALSDSPDEPGSSSWGNRVPRIAVIARLRDRATSAVFVVVNTHFDHLSRQARRRSAEALRRVVGEEARPSVVMGDLNTGEGSLPIRELLRDAVLRDAWAAAADRATPEWGTFPNYREPCAGRKRIDWIVVTGDIEVERIAINPSAPAGRRPSDHLPVQAVLRIPEGER
ncbi:endonuclease/exonuclease/phosphatase family metal-dependent hydrolase [Microbacterium sp. AK009]|uniref:endonuclease/exonuclease/phosphatase family protein n=1 Tax=Microbacterium sp. AK009 TaxID=2723068 RepID=UPI0015CB0772|nr:endonuclease/exonuclease/phosphatase family protein [Microbacterium sp. AK009]NYF18003.1 endonuclease/exonuclease/phosphatase family metal-dependent hydrolase [Microbacterium sp. AK009]